MEKNMKYLLVMILISGAWACDTPNNAASTRISTAPMSNDPTEVVPTATDLDDNRVRPRTGTAPTNEQLPDGTGAPAPQDSTAKR